MNRLWPILAFAAAAIVIAVLLLGGDPDDGDSLDMTEDYLEDEKNPELMTSEAAKRKRERDAEEARRKADDAARPPPAKPILMLQGVVVDDETGSPVAGATISTEAQRQPCPRSPQHLHAPPARGMRQSSVAATSGPDGRFTMTLPAYWGPKDAFDAFATAPGRVPAMLCAQPWGGDVTFRLPKALKLKVRVADQHGRPVLGAIVRAKPDEGVKTDLGHVGHAMSDEHGYCEIDGLLPGDILVTADHAEFMPTTEGPLDPFVRKEIEIRLLPAMRFTFKLRSDDGSEIKNPTLQWTTDGMPPHDSLLVMPVTPNGPPSAPRAEVNSTAVRVPCDHGFVQLELKADGFEAMRPPPEPLPKEGGEKEIIAVLVRDTSLAPLKLSFQDPDGKPVPYADLGAGPPSITSLDGKEIGSVTFTGGETLNFDSLPAGRYRIGKRSATYAPAEVDLEVRAGETNEVTVKLKPTAKLKVIFRSSEQITVRFRLRRSGRILPAFPEGGLTPTGAEGSGLQPLRAGEGGAVFTGLSAGQVTVDVTDPTLVAEAKTVSLREGETTEVEIDVRKR